MKASAALAVSTLVAVSKTIHPRVATDECHVRQIEPANLVDAVSDLVQPVVHVENGLTLQRRVDAVVVMPVEEPVVATHVPGNVPCVGHDPVELRSSDQAALCVPRSPDRPRTGGSLVAVPVTCG